MWTATTLSGLSSGAPSARDLADRAAAYVRELDAQLVSIVGHERYEQQSVETASGITFQQRRTLDARIAWVHVPGPDDTVAVREVLSVDGAPAVRSSRLEQLLRKPADALSSAVGQFLDESAAHNLEPGARNINFPTFPLVYLRAPHSDRTRWKVEQRDGPLTLLSFEELRRPTVVRSDRGDHLRAKGEFRVDEASGRVQRIEVRLAGREWVTPSAGELKASVAVEIEYRHEIVFAPNDRLGVWLPAHMNDRYRRSGGGTHLEVSGEATYSEYRRFETTGRLLTDQ